MMPSAAELIGSVRTIPMTTETTMPMMNGRCSVAQLMMLPRPVIIWEIGGPTSSPTTEPAPMVMTGVTMISTLVLPETRWPQVMPAKSCDESADLLNHRTDNQGCKRPLRHAAEAINEDVRGDFF